jgi:DNA invertase Pin-like site-specific DNA recombinase
MLKDAARHRFDTLAAWSVDRLGRSLQDLVALLGELRTARIDLFLHQQGIDTKTSAGKAMFQMIGVFAEFEREMIRERVGAGLARARAEGRIGGRPRTDASKIMALQAALAGGASIRKAAQAAGVSFGTAQRVAGELRPAIIEVG